MKSVGIFFLLISFVISCNNADETKILIKKNELIAVNHTRFHKDSVPVLINGIMVGVCKLDSNERKAIYKFADTVKNPCIYSPILIGDFNGNLQLMLEISKNKNCNLDVTFRPFSEVEEKIKNFILPLNLNDTLNNQKVKTIIKKIDSLAK